LDYKAKLESDISQKIQSMLEGIVGQGKAIVRVIAEIDFRKETRNEEEYDPASTVVRSSRDTEESSQAGDDAETVATITNQRSGVMPAGNSKNNSKKRRDTLTNYEINRITRSILQPAGTILRLSVAAVIDGIYQSETLADGSTERTYVARGPQELAKFEAIVRGAMGYSEDREDQVSVTEFPFSGTMEAGGTDLGGVEDGGMLSALGSSKRTILNLILVALVFLIVVRPLLKSLKGVTGTISHREQEQLPAATGELAQVSEAPQQNKRERVREISQNDREKAEQLLRSLISE